MKKKPAPEKEATLMFPILSVQGETSKRQTAYSLPTIPHKVEEYRLLESGSGADVSDLYARFDKSKGHWWRMKTFNKDANKTIHTYTSADSEKIKDLFKKGYKNDLRPAVQNFFTPQDVLKRMNEYTKGTDEQKLQKAVNEYVDEKYGKHPLWRRILLPFSPPKFDKLRKDITNLLSHQYAQQTHASAQMQGLTNPSKAGELEKAYAPANTKKYSKEK